MLSKKEQYEHPFWRRKANGILERDDYICRCCKSETTQLNVHHLYYENGLHLWEYDDEALITLCKDCHYKIHFDLAKLSGLIAFEILSGNKDATDFLNQFKSKKNGKG